MIMMVCCRCNIENLLGRAVEPARVSPVKTQDKEIIIGMVLAIVAALGLVIFFLPPNLGGGIYDGRVILAEANGTIYDYNNAATVENYKNGVVGITVEIQPGSATVRSIADPAYGGTTISVSNPTTGFSASVSLPDNISLLGTQITAVNTVPISAWGSEATDVVKMTVVMFPDNQGRLTAGSLISIILAPYGVDDAHDQTVAGNRMTDTAMWNEGDTINITIAGRDSITLVDRDGAYLQGSAWSG